VPACRAAFRSAPTPRKRFRLDVRHDARVRSCGSQRDDESGRVEERWVELGRESAQPLERIARVAPDLVEERTGGGCIRLAEPARQLKVDRDCGELLLHAVVELPLERPPVRIGGDDQARARSVEVLDLDVQTLDCFSMHRPVVRDGRSRVKGQAPSSPTCWPVTRRWPAR
jgi:hypothetical protein